MRTQFLFAILMTAGLACAQTPPQQSKPPQAGEATLAITRVRIGGLAESARRIHEVLPVYPPLAKMAGVQGTVKLQAVIGQDGSVKELKVLSGHPLLVKSALDAVRQWRYRPTLLKGRPVEVLTEIDVNYTLAPNSPSVKPAYKLPTPDEEAAEVKAEKDALAAVDPATAADIRKLIEITGVKGIMDRLWVQMLPQFRAIVLANLPQTNDREDIASRAAQDMVNRLRSDNAIYDMLIPIYARHFSDKDLKGILAFYESPLGHRFVSETPLLSEDLHKAFTAHWNLVVTPQIVAEMSKEFPPVKKTPQTVREVSSPH